jgi:hypothetical protein
LGGNVLNGDCAAPLVWVALFIFCETLSEMRIHFESAIRAKSIAPASMADWLRGGVSN